MKIKKKFLRGENGSSYYRDIFPRNSKNGGHQSSYEEDQVFLTWTHRIKSTSFFLFGSYLVSVSLLLNT